MNRRTTSINVCQVDGLRGDALPTDANKASLVTNRSPISYNPEEFCSLRPCLSSPLEHGSTRHVASALQRKELVRRSARAYNTTVPKRDDPLVLATCPGDSAFPTVGKRSTLRDDIGLSTWFGCAMIFPFPHPTSLFGGSAPCFSISLASAPTGRPSGWHRFSLSKPDPVIHKIAGLVCGLIGPYSKAGTATATVVAGGVLSSERGPCCLTWQC
mmetsp:Transcript_22194/g.51045  ORF Transcript_22194/g.51045 Transcript_22194/m.51045 type:complete len:214 (+) Transcript_22194:205-846(+)